MEYNERKVMRETIQGCVMTAIAQEIYNILRYDLIDFSLHEKERLFNTVEKVVL